VNEFEPGEGWREITFAEGCEGGREIISYRHPGPGPSSYTYWVREDPVRPLPTEPYTVIRAALPNGTSDVFIRNELGWYLLGEMEAPVHPLNFTAFEVLSEPRAVIAKAVLDRCEELAGYPVSIVQTVRREFGASS